MIDTTYKIKINDKYFELTREEALTLYVDLKSIFDLESHQRNFPLQYYVTHDPWYRTITS
jgi:hypothetical protein